MTAASRVWFMPESPVDLPSATLEREGLGRVRRWAALALYPKLRNFQGTTEGWAWGEVSCYPTQAQK